MSQSQKQADSLIQAPNQIQEDIKQKTDSLIQEPQIIQQVDSLHQKGIDTQRQVIHKTDSINRLIDTNRHLQDAAQKTQQKLNEPQKVKDTKKALSNIEQNTGLDVTPNAPGVPTLNSSNLPSGSLTKLPTANVPRMDIPDMSMPGVNIPGMSTPNGNVSGLPKLPTSLPSVKVADQIAEKQFSQMAGGKELLQQQKAMDQFKQQPQLYQKQGERFRDKNHWRQEAQQQALKALQTQTSALDEAKTSLTKLKRKYKTVQTDQDIYIKKASLKGESFKKRIATGVSLQIHQGPPTAFDISPFSGYRWSKRWITGIGGTYRFTFTPNDKIDWNQPIYGGRIYGEWIALKSFLLHAEGEALRAKIPSNISNEQRRRWIKSVLVGGGKQYEITKKLKGNVLYLYTYPYVPYGPYLVQHQIRFGFIFL